MTDFKTHAAQELTSLGAFALTINISLFIMISTIVLIQGFERVMLVLFPLTNLLFIVFAVAIFVVGLYFNQNSYYTQALPTWAATYTLYVIGFFVLCLGGIGYYSVTHGRFGFLLTYLGLLTFSAFTSLVSGLSMLLKTSQIQSLISKEWPSIAQRLRAQGYMDVSESVFSNFIEVNLKFGGLFVIVLGLF